MAIEPRDSDQQVPSSRLRDELRRLYSADASTTALDRRIQAVSRAHFARVGKLTLIRRLTPFAAAAAIVFAMMWMEPPSRPRPGIAQLAVSREDIDGNGRIDILDAFTLARRLDTAAALQPEWDVTGDGRVDAADVDAIAMAAVRLSRG